MPLIKFSLKCNKGHEFESWFSDNESFEAQSERGLVACPFCTSTTIEKALMAPNISTRLKKKNASISPPAPLAKQTEALALTSQVIEHIKQTTDNVGDKFAEEARKIHYEEVPARPIWGTATAEETKDLVDEGIEIVPLPPSPKEQN